jgi:LysR family transcriptional regulator, glycine cleavage system transcriptional activator
MAANSKTSAPDESGSAAAGVRRRLPPMKAVLAFEASARLGSFAAGAEELGVTPSAVSHQIQQLEDFLGVKLFSRHAGRAELTSAGSAYTREIGTAISMIANATAIVAPQSQAGHLVIASSPSFAAKWLQPRLPPFLETNPAIRVRVSTLSSHEELNKDRCDVAIVFGRPSKSVGQVEPLLVERLRPLCSPLLVEQLGLRTPDDLSGATLIHSVNALSWAEYLRRIGRPELSHAHDLWLDRSTMAIEAAVAGMGVILESELLTQREVHDGRLVAPFGESLMAESESYFLVRPAGFRNGTQVARFERWLRAQIVS